MNTEAPITLGSDRLAGWGIVALLALTVVLLLPGAAQAKDVVSGGKSTLKLNERTAEGIADSGIKLNAIDPAKLTKRGINFPIEAGELKTRNLVSGTLEHGGGLKLKSDDGKLRAKDFVVEINKRSKLTAKVGGKRISLFKLNIENAAADVGDDLVTLTKIKPTLTGAGARAINEALETRLFRKGVKFGKLGSKAKLETKPKGELALDGGASGLKVDPETAETLTDLGIDAAPLAPASSDERGFSFPITTGTLDTEGPTAEITHAGGLELTDGSATVELTDFRVKLRERSILSALIDGERVKILALDLDEVEVATRGGGKTVRVAPIGAAFTEGAATALNEAFETNAFEEGLVLGSLTIKGEVKKKKQ